MTDPLTLVVAMETPDCDHDGCNDIWETFVRKPTPAEFADIARQEGWVKLEGIDPEALGHFIVDGASSDCGNPDAECWLQDSYKGWWQKDLGESIVRYLAALDDKENHV